MNPDTDLTIEPVHPPAPLAPLPKDAREVFIRWEQPKDGHKIGALIVTSGSIAAWEAAHEKANDQAWGIDYHARTEKELLLCEWARRRSVRVTYLTQGDPKGTLEEQRDELVEWAHAQKIYLVHGKGGKL